MGLRVSRRAQDLIDAASADQLRSYSLAQQLKEAKRRERQLLERIRELQEAVGVESALREAPHPKPIKRRGRSGARQATAVVLASDWHVEERVDPDRVSGSNAYDPKIARARVERMAEGVAWLLKLNRQAFKIGDVVLWLGGDLISGSIHPELVESNALGPTAAVVLAEQLAELLIDHIAAQDLDRVQVVCSRGNHGRMTQKTRIKTNAENSLEQLLYHSLARRYSDHKVVDVHVPAGEHAYVDAYGYVLRFQHGDAVRGGGGVGGIWPPLLKAQYRWQQTRRADIDHLGHFHQLRFFPGLIVNGSLIGPSEYSLRFGHEAPAQGFYLVDSHRGQCQQTPIWVDK